MKLAKQSDASEQEYASTLLYKTYRLEHDWKRILNTNPVGHGAELIGMALRLIVEERPLLLLGVPGAMLTMLGVGTGVYLLWYFNLTRYFSIPVG